MAGWRANIIYRARALVRIPVSLGVRFLLHDELDRVLLIKHTYAAGWHLPGGAVDPGESAREAAIRELREETGISLAAPATFLGLYFNESLAKRDHVAVYMARHHPPLDDTALKPQALEISAVILAPLTDLPAGTTAATRRRLAEAFNGADVSETW